MPHRVRLFSFICLSALLAVCSPPVHGDDDAPADEKKWNIAGMIKGTTAQVRDTVNGPLEAQLARKAEKQGRYDEAKQAYDRRLAAVLADLRKSSPQYAKAETDLAAATTALKAAHDRGDGSAAIDAQNRIHDDQAEMKKSVDDASSKDVELTKDKKQMDDAAVELRHQSSVVATAAKARDQLIDGLRSSVELPGPASAGGVGVVGRVKPTKIIDAHSFTADYALFTKTGVDENAKDVPDGVTVYKGNTQTIKILIVGYEDTTKLKENVECLADQYYKLRGQKNVGGRSYWVVERVDPDAEQQRWERLFKALDTLRVPDSKPAEESRR